MTTANLRLVLEALRSFNDHITLHGQLNPEALAGQMGLERLIADRVMFNAGWNAAMASDAKELAGTASTDKLLPALIRIAETSRDYAAAADRLAKVNAEHAKREKPGRKKGSYEDWHFAPGYSVVVAMIQTEPAKKRPDHVRWAVKNGWLDKGIADRTHLRRIELIQRRQAAERAKQLADMGANVVPFKSKRKSQKQAK